MNVRSGAMRGSAIDHPAEWHCLQPYRRDEAIEVHWVAFEIAKTERTIRNWCAQYGHRRPSAQERVQGPVAKIAAPGEGCRRQIVFAK
jgi:hypothetical protein